MCYLLFFVFVVALVRALCVICMFIGGVVRVIRVCCCCFRFIGQVLCVLVWVVVFVDLCCFVLALWFVFLLWRVVPLGLLCFVLCLGLLLGVVCGCRLC